MSSKTKEAARLIKVQGGKISGRINADNGHLDNIRPTGELKRIYSSRAGKINVETGHIMRLAKDNRELATACSNVSYKWWFVSPDGERFANLKLAGISYCCSRGAIQRRCSRGSQGWSKILKTDLEITQLIEQAKINFKIKPYGV